MAVQAAFNFSFFSVFLFFLNGLLNLFIRGFIMNDDKVFTKKQMADRIDYLVDCGFDRDVAIKIAMFKGSNGIVFAIPSK